MKSACAWAVVLSCLSTSLFAEETLEEKLSHAPPILRVEEDWEVVVADPEPENDLPQIVTVFGPTDAAFGTHTVFELNHGTLPDYTQGGMQLQVWWSNALVGYKAQFAPVELHVVGEVITYTTVTRLNRSENILTMEVVNGHSVTHGNFGSGDGLLRLRMYTFRDHLNPYNPNNSIAYSRVTYGANKVNRFVRKAIRFYDEDGLYCEDNTRTYVHRLATDVQLEQASTTAGTSGTSSTSTSSGTGSSDPVASETGTTTP